MLCTTALTVTLKPKLVSLTLGVCGKLKFSSEFGFGYKKSKLNLNRPKSWQLCRRFSKRNCVQSAVQIKSDKNNFTCIQCADKERFKTWPKPSLTYRF